jgi:bifunctional non-homologous end joining protein LigD
MSLKEYRSKRIFTKTKEPRPRKKTAGKKALEFVIQKHAASHLHYDFRLEAEGVLKSWAIPKGIPVPGEKHLAMMVEDHPFEYRNFEGIIPKGNYGAGKVIIWDRGTYEPKTKNISAGIKNGDLKFVLSGKKIQGEFALVKIRKANDNSWLLIRKYINDDFLKEDEASVVSGKMIEQIGEEFDFEKISGATKSKMPLFVKPMLAKTAKDPFNRENWIFEFKWDGYRVIARKQNKIDLFSRNGKKFNETFFSIIESLEKIKQEFIFDGEVIAVDKSGKTDFQLLQNYFTARNGILIYYVFDLLFWEGIDFRDVQLKDRKSILARILPKLPNVRISEHIENEGEKLFESAKRNKFEGIIAKNLNSKYRAGFRSDDWLKIRAILTQEAIICGFTMPRGGRKKFGALILGVYDAQKLTYAGHVGTGFDDHMLDFLFSKLHPLVTIRSPFEKNPKTNMPVTWVKPEIVCQIKYTEWTKDGSMRHPVFLGIREDKNAKDVIKEEINSAPNKSKKVFALKNENVIEIEKIISGHKLKFTNLNKVFWPDEGYTKGDLINYYQRISKWILPYLKDRPQSLNRYPNGIFGGSFFQKNMEDIPAWINAVDVYSDSEQRSIRYMLCNKLADLLYMINLGCIEINTWNSRVEALDNPDYAVFDIDPADVPFSQAVKTAQEIKKILDKIKVKGFCKTSGGRGIHIYVPLRGGYDYDQVKDFAQVICLLVNKKMPKFTSLERDPKKRQGKIYLDYLQNRRGQTMAAPYCVRPRVGAMVSTPIDWKELNDDLNPAEFTMLTIFARLKKRSDPWKNFFTEKADLLKTMEILEKMIKY